MRPIRVACLLLIASSLYGGEADVATVKRLNDSYAEGWRRNDRTALLALFRSDAVIIPSGSQPIQGTAAIANFWWPPNGGRTTVTEFRQTTDEIGGNADYAFARGTFAFDFTYEVDGNSQKLSNAGNYLMLFARDERGQWQITHRMWSDRRR